MRPGSGRSSVAHDYIRFILSPAFDGGEKTICKTVRL
jgi:hypothetical protein